MPDIKVGVGALVVDAGGWVLLGRKGTTSSLDPAVRRYASGKIVTPGGRVEFGETLVDAVKREVREEANIRVDVIVPLLYVHEEIREDAHFLLHMFKCHPVGRADATAGDDLTEVFWASGVMIQELYNEMTPITREMMKWRFR